MHIFKLEIYGFVQANNRGTLKWEYRLACCMSFSCDKEERTEFKLLVTIPSRIKRRPLLKKHTFCAASCSSLWAITLCLAALELNLPPEPIGGKGLDSVVDASFSLPRFFFSGMRSGALASRATPEEKQNYNHCTVVRSYKETKAVKLSGWWILPMWACLRAPTSFVPSPHISVT